MEYFCNEENASWHLGSALQAPTETTEKGAPIWTCPLWNYPPDGGRSIHVELDPSFLGQGWRAQGRRRGLLGPD